MIVTKCRLKGVRFRQALDPDRPSHTQLTIPCILVSQDVKFLPFSLFK